VHSSSVGTLSSPLDLQSPLEGISWGVQVTVAFPFDVSAMLSTLGIIDYRSRSFGVSIRGKLDLMSPSGRGVTLVPNRVQVSHVGLVGTAEDLLSQTTKLRYHVMSQVIRIMCEIT
jgi:hypothetical protein